VRESDGNQWDHRLAAKATNSARVSEACRADASKLHDNKSAQIIHQPTQTHTFLNQWVEATNAE
jgi:hypothetical protein